MPNPSLGELFTQTWQKIDQMKLHVCLSGEYNVTTLVPTVDYPEENTFYLVPNGTGNNVYTEWVYVNNNWERFGQASIDLSDYVQKTDYATGTNVGLVKTISTLGLYISPGDGTLNIAKATDEQVKAGTQVYKPITPVNQHMAAFYGLAKAAGDSTQAASDNEVGTYTNEAKQAIRDMLGVQDNFTRNSINRIVSLGTSAIDGTEKTITLYIKLLQEGAAQLVIGSNATTIHLTKSTADNKIYYTSTETLEDGVTPILTLYHDSSATVSATVTYQIASDTTYSEQQEIALYYPSYNVLTAGIQAFVTSPKTGYFVKLLSTEDIATDVTPGAVKVNAGHGIAIDSDGVLQLTTPTTSQLQALTNGWLAPRLNTMHAATFYGLAKAAGDTTQASSNNAVGTYTAEAKAAIRSMLGLSTATDALASDAYLNIVAEGASVETGENGKYIQKDNSKQTSSSYNISTSIALPANSTIKVLARGYQTNVAVIAKVNSDSSYTALVNSIDSNEHFYQYTTFDPINVVISSHKDTTPVYSIYSSKIDEMDSRLHNIEEDLFAFTTMGVIGDSLASGTSNYTGGTADRPNYAWGKYFERIYGTEVSLFAKGGFTTRNWLSNQDGLTAMQAANPLECYIIGLGQNDAYSLGDEYLGTVEDIHVGDEASNADTYYGNYSKIIAAIKTKSPRAKIFCLTNARPVNTTKLNYNTAIRTIVPLYTNTYLVDLADDSFYDSSLFTSVWNGAHSSPIGYKLIAKNIHDNLVNVIRQNITSFKDIQWIIEDHP